MGIQNASLEPKTKLKDVFGHSFVLAPESECGQWTYPGEWQTAHWHSLYRPGILGGVLRAN